MYRTPLILPQNQAKTQGLQWLRGPFSGQKFDLIFLLQIRFLRYRLSVAGTRTAKWLWVFIRKPYKTPNKKGNCPKSRPRNYLWISYKGVLYGHSERCGVLYGNHIYTVRRPNMNTLPVLCIIIPLAAIFMHWRIRSGYYKKTRLPIRDRLLWAFICSAPPVAAFMSRPNLYMGIVICIIFLSVLLFGSKLEKTSEQSNP